MSDKVAEALLDNYIWQKAKLLEEAGCSGVLDERRLRDMSRDRMEKMAHIVRDWDVKPPVIMAAVFEWAKKNRHPDGPMPNMLLSVKYLSKAIGDYLQVPYEAVAKLRAMDVYLKRKDADYEDFRKTMAHAKVTDATTATSYPAEYRCIMALTRLDWNGVVYMAPETLAAMTADSRVMTWMERRGVSFQRLAKIFNNAKKQK